MEEAAVDGAARGQTPMRKPEREAYRRLLQDAKAKLEREFPGWRFWYLPLCVGGAKWCGQPSDSTHVRDIVRANTAGLLANAISETIARTA